MEKKEKSHVGRALIISLVFILLNLALMMLVGDLRTINKFQWVSYIIITGAFAIAAILHARDKEGNVTFGNVFAYGFKTAAVVTIIMVFYTLLYFTVIDPGMKDKMLEFAREEMLEKGQTESQAEAGMKFLEKSITLFAVIGVLLTYLILGAIGSLLGAVFAKKNPVPEPFQ